MRTERLDIIGRRTLKLSITTLDFLVASLLYVALKDTCSCWFVEAGGFQNVCGIDPIIGLASHHMLFLPLWTDKLEFPYRVL